MGVAVAFKYHELVSFDMVKVIALIGSLQTSMNSSKHSSGMMRVKNDEVRPRAHHEDQVPFPIMFLS